MSQSVPSSRASRPSALVSLQQLGASDKGAEAFGGGGGGGGPMPAAKRGGAQPSSPSKRRESGDGSPTLVVDPSSSSSAKTLDPFPLNAGPRARVTGGGFVGDGFSASSITICWGRRNYRSVGRGSAGRSRTTAS